MSSDKHQQLPELSDDRKESARGPALDPEDDGPDVGTKQLPRPTRPVSQWRLLKIMRQQERKRMALSDIRWLFDLPENDDALIEQGIRQLTKSGRIRAVLGSSQRTFQTGTVYTVTVKGAKDEPNARNRETE